MIKTIVFTDLDGTLLDHHTYAADEALEALALLYQHQIPVIFCSSKTMAEQVDLQQHLQISHPFIIENGSAIVIPDGYFLQANSYPYSSSKKFRIVVLSPTNTGFINQVIQTINKKLNTTLAGYATSSTDTIAQKTGLSGRALLNAKDRMFTETLLSGTPTPDAIIAFQQAGLQVSQGGRFFSIQDQTTDKGAAVRKLINMFSENQEQPVFSVGIGDSPNDFAMLAAVDQAFLVQQHNHTWSTAANPAWIRIPAPGPPGFTAMVKHILSTTK